jgi:NAD(P)-dependent dehydrogenase (short-subunit alcohol dehydrogenase family)
MLTENSIPNEAPQGTRPAVPFDEPPFPPDLLAGEVALVTGGGSGMGLGMASALAQAGARIAVLGRSAERTADGVAAIRAIGGDAVAVPGDVRDPAAVAQSFDLAEKAFGPVSILANNAGGNFAVLADAMSPNAWRAVTRIAIDGTFFCSAEFARRRIALERPGAIVNNSAQYVWSGFPGDAHSAAAKAAIVTMTEALAREWKPHGIRVNCVAAGFFPHAGTPEGSDPEALGKLAGMIPAGRVGEMQEFGWASAFLCSPLAGRITGETLVIDGTERLRRTLLGPAFVPPRDRRTIWGELS